MSSMAQVWGAGPCDGVPGALHLLWGSYASSSHVICHFLYKTTIPTHSQILPWSPKSEIILPCSGHSQDSPGPLTGHRALHPWLSHWSAALTDSRQRPCLTPKNPQGPTHELCVSLKLTQWTKAKVTGYTSETPESNHGNFIVVLTLYLHIQSLMCIPCDIMIHGDISVEGRRLKITSSFRRELEKLW